MRLDDLRALLWVWSGSTFLAIVVIGELQPMPTAWLDEAGWILWNLLTLLIAYVVLEVRRERS